jgi:hypothetical protein
MYAIYGNIYHQYTPNVSIYTSTMDPMGHEVGKLLVAPTGIWLPIWEYGYPSRSECFSLLTTKKSVQTMEKMEV